MDRKNILLISFDDAVAPWPYKSAFGEPLQIPNLDRLCGVSTAFHSAYAQAPVCSPSRASMMTMMMPPELGLLDNSTFVFNKVPPQLGFSHHLKTAGFSVRRAASCTTATSPLFRCSTACCTRTAARLLAMIWAYPKT